MEKSLLLSVIVLFCVPGFVLADSFGTGANQFEMEFVTISGDTNPTSGIPAGDGFTFTGVNNDYRIGTYEVTNDQWDKYLAETGTDPGNDRRVTVLGPFRSFFTGTHVPANEVSWYEAAHFVNYLNTSTGHQAAYKFTTTSGTSDYTFAMWESGDVGYNASNPFRNSNAFYFLPTENEWVKAAYWNGTTLQEYATKAGETLFQGDGVSGDGWNYFDGEYVLDPRGPWDVGSGSEELNGTFDMMGNVWERTESPSSSGDYLPDSYRSSRGGSYWVFNETLNSSSRSILPGPYDEHPNVGFRVASVPEPCTLLLLGLGGLLIRRKKKG